jgi:uncharacterized membrane protein
VVHILFKLGLNTTRKGGDELEALYVLIIVAVVTAVLGAIFSTVGFLIMRVLKNIDVNQQSLADSLKALWASYSQLLTEFHELKGEHKVNHKRSGIERRSE